MPDMLAFDQHIAFVRHFRFKHVLIPETPHEN
jgi:hypothetical protein